MKPKKYEKELYKIAEKIGNERIIFSGHIEQRELYKYYNLCDIQVIPTIGEEGAGLVAIEGAYAGLPLIVTNSGGLVEFVSPSSSIILNKESNLIQNLSKTIMYLAEHPNICEKMSDSSKQNAMKYTKKAYYQNFIQIMDKIASNDE